MLLSNTPSHNPLKQQAVTRRVFKLPPKSGSSKNPQPIREALLGNVYHVSWTTMVPSMVLYFTCFHLWNFKLPRHFAIS
jgi:hypothetical protein